MAVYVVGDIQGCYEPLRQLLDNIAFDPAKDTLWCTGDLVNRGPDSLKTLRYLKSLGDACICVLGNHDLHLLELVAGGQPYRRDTLSDVIEAPDCHELIEWLRSRPLLHHDAGLGWCMVHAGLHPRWSLNKAIRRAHAVEANLRGDEWKTFCQQLHHMKFPVSEPAKDDPARALFSTAVFTRTRYCTQDGFFNWNVRTGSSSNKKEKAWFKHNRLAWVDDCNVVYGHWAANGLVAGQPHVLGLDTGCVWGGSLTLARLEKGGCKQIESEQVCAVQAKDAHSQPTVVAGELNDAATFAMMIDETHGSAPETRRHAAEVSAESGREESPESEQVSRVSGGDLPDDQGSSG
ncbi:symmetrical bis(5'-nucleosyl)-tetraphosphatase [Mariprofundus ferrooxydans]|uniref:bis(5'-nucleosyl)-tetraphosphatase (symmetrical) n=1 Tax=Mariprofundus ferrooxydans PV-1 TaxID=314345 RepID=Q0F2D8_9PROT|nr:symmetrical bis(5'-nucleosyl)-tetraphosphatase [Mariprofundus ferrooxydans]EAU55612.1 diadenosinetetraphosphatase [Mariprofundus ferrooxydans PV-1]KON48654.1 diadenosine tetraphosphate hydrolase [Mariprofundus ferrooxydans]